jgi:arylsulfatase A-like enzyme
VVFFSDHGEPFPRAKSMLYGAGTGISLILRPPTRLGVAPAVYDELFSGVDLLPTLLDLLRIEIPADVEGISHAENLLRPEAETVAVRERVFTEKTFHDSFDPARAVRTKEYSYIENYLPTHLVDLPQDVEDSPSGKVVAPLVTGPRPARELYNLLEDPAELKNLLAGDVQEDVARIADELALLLHQWREQTGDVCPSEFAGPRILAASIETYVEATVRTLGMKPTSHSPIGIHRGLRELTRSKR